MRCTRSSSMRRMKRASSSRATRTSRTGRTRGAGRIAAWMLWLAAAAWVAPCAAALYAEAPSAEAPAAAELRAEALYTRTEHLVPMRDGVRLFTVVYRSKAPAGPQPILLSRTPYSAQPPGGAFIETRGLAPSEAFLHEGYTLVFQDVRGAYRSEGAFVYLKPIRQNRKDPRAVDESTDTYDTISWLLRHVPGNNGRVGLWGISYDGWQSVMGLVDPHPALKAVSPQATTADAFIGDDNHFNGAFYLAGSLGWAQPMSIATGPDRAALDGRWPEGDVPGPPRGYDFFLQAGPTNGINRRHFGGRLSRIWEDLIEHPDHDEYWQRRSVAQYMTNVRIPVLSVAGWYDHADPYGTFATYRAIEERNPRNLSTIVAGPWRHGGWLWDDGSQFGPHRFGRTTAEDFKREVVFPFFEKHLKGRGDWQPAEALVFETGGNAWHRFDQWPPRGAVPTALYLREGGRLTFARGEAGVNRKGVDAGNANGERADASDEFVSDPAKPVPHTQSVLTNSDVNPLVEDQRLVSTRPDVLVYATDVLESDVTIAGATLVRLFVSTSGSDGDWFVRLIDVFPDSAEDAGMRGYQMPVAMQVMRGKYRNSYSHPEPMVPGAVTPLLLTMPDRMHTFRKGHRIMVHVHGSWFPEFDRNPQVFTNIYAALPGDYRKAVQKVYRSGESASRLELPVFETAGPPAGR